MSGKRGTLCLVPNALDFGIAGADEAVPFDEVLPPGVLRAAARLEHWVAENARSTRAFLKRVERCSFRWRSLQQIGIVELPRVRPKGGRPRRCRPRSGTAARALLAGHDLGLISEAGLPAVADPGAALVQAAHTAGIEVVALPGPSSLLLALAASGLNGQSFAFVGYLPVDAPRAAAPARTGGAVAQGAADAVADRDALPQRRDAGRHARAPAGRHAHLGELRPDGARRLHAQRHGGGWRASLRPCRPTAGGVRPAGRLTDALARAAIRTRTLPRRASSWRRTAPPPSSSP